MTKEFLEKLFEGTIFIFLAGVILLLFSATSGISIGNFQIEIPDMTGRIILAVVGLILTGIGIIVQIKGYSKSNSSPFSVSNVLTEWNRDEFRKKLDTATDVRMMGVSNYGLLSSSTKEFQNFLNRGGQLRCIYVTPNGEALKMIAKASVGVESDVEHLKTQSRLTIEFLQDIVKSSPKGSVQVKEIDHTHSTVMTLIDPLLPNGIAYVTVNGYGQIYTERPCIVVSKAKNLKWFEHFVATFENTWKSPNSINIL